MKPPPLSKPEKKDTYRAGFLNQGAQAPWGALRFLQGCLGKMSKNCPKLVYKPEGGTSLPFSYTKPQVFIVHHYNFPAAGLLTKLMTS
ncbi:unnamed protein product, partial [Staurois parvus]